MCDTRKENTVSTMTDYMKRSNVFKYELSSTSSNSRWVNNSHNMCCWVEDLLFRSWQFPGIGTLMHDNKSFNNKLLLMRRWWMTLLKSFHGFSQGLLWVIWWFLACGTCCGAHWFHRLLYSISLIDSLSLSRCSSSCCSDMLSLWALRWHFFRSWSLKSWAWWSSESA